MPPRTPLARSICALALVGLLAACSASGSSGEVGARNGSEGRPGAAAPATPTPRLATLSVSPADGATGVLPTSPVVVEARAGTLTSVRVTDSKGRAVSGGLSGGRWSSEQRLRPATAYTVAVEATGPEGAPTRTTSSFRVLKPRVTATYGISHDGQTVGVGMPAIVQFDSAVVTRAQRAAVEKAVTVTTVPKQEGAWGWLDSRQLMYRPKSYWKPGTVVNVSTPFTGIQTGDGKWVANDDTGRFTVGSSMVSTIDVPRHTMTVRRDGKVLRTIPVSNGKPGPKTETRSGVKVIMSKERTITMDSSTVGIPKGSPGYYRIDTDYNMRVTWTGEFLHSAPWSVGAQGSSNVSHGCTNLSPSHAAWMYANSKPGDVVKVTGSNRTFLPTEGIGVWQYSWEKWQQQSALR